MLVAGARQHKANITMRATMQTHRENGFFDHVYVDASADTRDPIALIRTNMRQRHGGDTSTATDLCMTGGSGPTKPSLARRCLQLSWEAW